MVVDDRFKCTLLVLQSDGSKFKFEVQQARDGRIPDRTLVHIHELPKVKATEILPLNKIGRKEKFEAALAIDELEGVKLEYHFDKTYDLTLKEYMEKNLKLDILPQEEDDALKEAEAPGLKTQQLTIRTLETFGSNIFHSELKKATRNFDISMKIGEGGFAIVYKGFLRGTTVAIKTLRPEILMEQSGFEQEAMILSRVRHPNIVTLIGYCSQPFSLVYEHLSKGSLEDRLACKNGSPPLSWQVRTRIIAEIRSALIFLHSNKPHPIVHGDLKPDNIFLDANMVSKLGDFGICSFLDNRSAANSFYHLTDHPKGTFGYIDPEYFTSGRLTTQSDIFSFGVIILRLVSGRPARGIIEEAQKAINKWRMSAVTDPLAGDWPAAQAKELLKLGVRCCHHDRKKRPQLHGKEWRFVEASLPSVS